MFLFLALFYSILIYIYISLPKNSLYMIRDFPKWWALLTYDGFKPHANINEGLKNIAEESIRFGKEEAGENSFNKSYGKFQVNKDKA